MTKLAGTSYDRNNTQEFCICARQIFDYLASFPNDPLAVFRDDLLFSAFQLDNNDIASLTTGWSTIWSAVFPDITFHYDRIVIDRRLFPSGNDVSDEFLTFISYVNIIREWVNA
jgi:hypothetical protein